MVRTIAALILALLLPASARAATLEAESFSHDSSAIVTHPPTASNGHALAFLENSTATLTVDTPAATALKVRARGGVNCSGWPHLVASVDGNVFVDALVTQPAWSGFYVPFDLSAGAHTFQLAFDNAYEQPDCKRILRVDAVRLYEAGTLPWRAFADSSIWNTPAQRTNAQQNPWPGSFTSYDPGLVLGGGPGGSSSHDSAYRKALFWASPGDPCLPLVQNEPTWVAASSGVKVTTCIPVPHGVKAAEGSDGHLSVVSVDRTIQWQMWRCVVNGSPCSESNVLAAGHYQSTDGSQWNLTGSGTQNCCGSAGGRGSGTPIITTTLTPQDARDGVNHALGITVPSVASSYIYPPAVKSDGHSGPLEYGQLFVLRADFPETGSVGRVNVIRGLKQYGMYVVDQGASFEIDTVGDSEPGDFQAWKDVGIDRTALNDIRPTDLRFVP